MSGFRRWSLLVLDSFIAHSADEVCKSINKTNTENYSHDTTRVTCILQPLDVAIYRPFKAEMQRLWCEWMIDSQHTPIQEDKESVMYHFYAGGSIKRGPL